MIRIAVVLTAVVALSCDTRQNFEAPEWTLSRMLVQPRYSTYGESRFFADGRAARPRIEGTVARDDLLGPATVVRGSERGRDATVIPVPVTRALVQTGRERFDEVCAACHGVRGDGVSVVATKMQLRSPPSLLEADIAAFPPGRLFRVISEGYGLMMPMRELLDVDERWAVVAYVKALELSQGAKVSDLPERVRLEIARNAP